MIRVPGNGVVDNQGFETTFTAVREKFERICEYAEQAAGELLGHWLELLPQQQRTVVEHRFGLHGKGRQTLEEVGQLLGVTRERVRQVQLAALTRLREISRREGVMETPFME